ncbi:MAG: LamG domain-containing protein, partial [Ignavibacteria bacterium]
DGQPENGSQIRWYKNGVLQTALNDLKVVSSSYTTVGDQWYYTVTPSDGVGFGTMQTSYTTTIRNNALPTTGTPVLTTSGGSNTASILICTPSTSDANGDAYTNIYNWLVNGASITGLNMPFDTYSATTATDYSGNGNNGVITGSTWSTGGISGGYMKFDGNDVIIVPDKASVGGDGTWNAISLEFWVNPSVAQTGSRIIAKKLGSDDSGSYMVGFATSPPSNTLFFGVTVNDTWYDLSSNTKTVIPTGTWSHVVCTYQSGTGLAIYINGALSASMVLPVSGPIYSEPKPAIQPVYIGYDGGSNPVRFFKGGLDEVKIYNRALTPNQIQQRYQEGMNSITTTSKIMPSELKAGDTWSCQVTPNDGFGDGVSATSNSVTLTQGTNSNPVVNYNLAWGYPGGLLTPGGSIATGSTVRMYTGVSDPSPSKSATSLIPVEAGRLSLRPRGCPSTVATGTTTG